MNLLDRFKAWQAERLVFAKVREEGTSPLTGKKGSSKLTTADITILSATPGSGKTLRAVQMMDQAMAGGEKVYSCDVNGISLPGIMLWEDPTKWEDLPAGSILFVDEAQRRFPQQRSIPDYIKAMETIRHKGVRLVLITQTPSFLHEHIRGLVGRHEHLLRKFGGSKITIYRADELMANVTSIRSRSSADAEVWTLPKEYFPFFKSAEIHTRKFQLPTKARNAFILLTIAALLLGKVGYSVYHRVTDRGGPEAEKASSATGKPASVSEQGLAGGTDPQSSILGPMSTEDYFARFQPRELTQPASAPAYDKRAVVAQPKIYCMLSAPNCRCFTEQATVYILPFATCAYMARIGPAYDPFLAPARSASSPAPGPAKEPEPVLDVGRPLAPEPSIPLDAPRVRPGVLNPNVTPLTSSP